MALGDVFLEILDPVLEGVSVVSPTVRSDAFIELLEGPAVEVVSVELSEFMEFYDGRGPRGDPGAIGGAALDAHVSSNTPHPVYDDMVDLVLYLENGMA